MLKRIRDYFVPAPPKEVSRESADALRADVKAAGLWGELGEGNRDKVDAWVRHSDRQARAANREWLKPRARNFALRWAMVWAVSWIGAGLARGKLAFEVPLTLAGFVAACIAAAFLFIHRSLNSNGVSGTGEM